jgi:metal-sulfur cluster biosynthetic enzyme
VNLFDSVWEALQRVQDPCAAQLGKPMDLVTMGLVETVTVHPDRIDIELVLTEPGCVFFFKFLDDIAREVEPIAGPRKVNVSMHEQAMWTPDRIRVREPRG